MGLWRACVEQNALRPRTASSNQNSFERHLLFRDATSRLTRFSLASQGAGGGLGFETARVLALNGARVTVTARSQASAETAVAKLRAALGAAGASAQLRPLELDLSTCASTKKGAEAFLATGEPLDVLICNAGV